MRFNDGSKMFTVQILTQIVDCKTNDVVYTHKRQKRMVKAVGIERYESYESAEAAAEEAIGLIDSISRFSWIRL